MKLVKLFLEASNIRLSVSLIVPIYSLLSIFNNYNLSQLFMAMIIGLFIPILASPNQKNSYITPEHPIIVMLPHTSREKARAWLMSYHLTIVFTLFPTLIVVETTSLIMTGQHLQLSSTLIFLCSYPILCTLFMMVAPAHIAPDNKGKKRARLRRIYTGVTGVILILGAIVVDELTKTTTAAIIVLVAAMVIYIVKLLFFVKFIDKELPLTLTSSTEHASLSE